MLAQRTWFLSMILSQLCYGSNSFFPGLSAHLLGQLEKMFKAGIRATLQQRILTPTAPLLSLLSTDSRSVVRGSLYPKWLLPSLASGGPGTGSTWRSTKPASLLDFTSCFHFLLSLAVSNLSCIFLFLFQFCKTVSS